MRLVRLPTWLIIVNVVLAIIMMGVFMAGLQAQPGEVPPNSYFMLAGYIVWTTMTSLYVYWKKTSRHD